MNHGDSNPTILTPHQETRLHLQRRLAEAHLALDRGTGTWADVHALQARLEAHEAKGPGRAE
jgi:hypothetical protein